MTHYRIALNFEDGVTRFVDCGANEKVLDAAFRNRINLPMDCSDGVCGTCKCRAETGSYDLGDDYIDEALTADEAAEGLVLTCQMVPKSDCVIAVPVPSTACKTGTAQFTAVVDVVTTFADAAYELALDVPEDAPAFLPGQYVNIGVPGSGQHRSYSFSSATGARRMLAKGEPVEAVLEALSKGLTQKMLHGTLAELHASDGEARQHPDNSAPARNIGIGLRNRDGSGGSGPRSGGSGTCGCRLRAKLQTTAGDADSRLRRPLPCGPARRSCRDCARLHLWRPPLGDQARAAHLGI